MNRERNLRNLALLGAILGTLSFPVGLVLVFLPPIVTLTFGLLAVIMGIIALRGIKEKRSPCYIAIGFGTVGLIFWVIFILLVGWSRLMYV